MFHNTINNKDLFTITTVLQVWIAQWHKYYNIIKTTSSHFIILLCHCGW